MKKQTTADISRTKNAALPTTKDHASYLFIAGAPRCGTTTLFSNLAGHPEVAASRVKEPGFLIPHEFPMRGFRHLCLEDGLQPFRELFDGKPGVRMEASATYLYAPGVAERIHKHFPNAKVILILRDPIKRFFSEYQFSMMMRVIPHDMIFSDYIELQRSQPDNDRWRQPELRALSNGLYSRFIPEYLKYLGSQKVHIVWTESLKANPTQVMQDICRFAKIDPNYFNYFKGGASNTSLQISRPLLYSIHFQVEAWLARRIAQGEISFVTRFARRFLSKPLRALSTRAAQPISLLASEKMFLKSYYADEANRLEKLVGKRPPW